MTKYVLANWKAHKTLSDAETWIEKFRQLYNPHPQVEVIIAPSTLCLPALRQKLTADRECCIALASQDLSSFPLGSYTGETPAEMLRGLVTYAILGHSERRRYFHETNHDIANKVSEALAADIKPVLCVDLPYARSQIAALNEEGNEDLIIGYGPVEAIGIDIPQTIEKTREAIKEIQTISSGKPILYGGSINKGNVVDYLEIPGVAGVMAGSASLDPEEFAFICAAASRG